MQCVVFSSYTGLAKCFTKTRCHFSTQVYPTLGNGKNISQKKHQMRSTALAVDFGYFLRGGIRRGSRLGPMIEIVREMRIASRD